MRANEEALRATNLDCLGRATKIHGDIFVSNAYSSFISFLRLTVKTRVLGADLATMHDHEPQQAATNRCPEMSLLIEAGSACIIYMYQQQLQPW